jgi:hypothetical protein
MGINSTNLSLKTEDPEYSTLASNILCGAGFLTTDILLYWESKGNNAARRVSVRELGHKIRSKADATEYCILIISHSTPWCKKEPCSGYRLGKQSKPQVAGS